MKAPSYHPDFYWPAPRQPERGYRWIDGKLEEVPGAKFRDYEPAAEEGLFLNFADTPATPEGILAFANRYGLLGAGAIGPDGETLGAWRKGIQWFKLLTSLWQAVRGFDLPFINAHLRWEKDFVHCPDLPALPGIALGQPIRLDRAALKKTGITRTWADSAAYVFLAEVLNAACAEVALPAWFVDPEKYPPRLVRYYRIRSLFGALLVQFSEAEMFLEDYVQCAACGRWFELEPGVNRADRTTCSDACRQKLHRQRRAHALRLHASGKTAKEIAAEVGSAVDTVTNWIKNSKAKER